MMSSNSSSETESSSNHPILGVIGCGNIGRQQVKTFLTHGYSVYVHDINPNTTAQLQPLGASIAQNYTELATHSDIVFTALPTPDDVIRVVLKDKHNLSQGLHPGSVYVDLTTNSPQTILKLYEKMQHLGVEMLDAPFNDCPVGAESEGNRGLAIMPSGSKQTFDRVKPILTLMADHVLYCGEITHGTQCKLIHNAVNAVAVQAVSEGITLGLSQGIPLHTLWDALRFGAFGQNAGDIHGLPHYWFSRRCDDISQPPAFTIKLLLKDLRIALKLAKEHHVPVNQLSLTVKDYEEAEKRGWSNHAATKVRCLQEERAGVTAEADLSVSSNFSQSNVTQQQEVDSPLKKRRFSLLTVLILVLGVNILQIGLYFLFNKHFNLF